MTTRVGILSAAHVHTDAYVRGLSQLDNVELVGVADENANRGRATAARHKIEYLDIGRLLEHIDAGVICAANVDHLSWAKRAAKAGVHVLCEKPLAVTVEEAKEIVALFEEGDAHLGVAMPLRFSDPVQRAAQRLDDGALGDLLAVSGTNRGQMPGGWFTDPPSAGGGSVMDHTVHIVDLVTHLTGCTVSEVYAEIDTRFHDIAVDDINVLSMKLDNGAGFLLDGSWSKPDEWHTWGDAALEFVGESGTIAVDCFDQTLWHTTDTGDESGVSSVFWGTDPNQELLKDFITAVQNNHPPEITGREAVHAVAVVEAAYRSATSGDPEAVEF